MNKPQIYPNRMIKTPQIGRHIRTSLTGNRLIYVKHTPHKNFHPDHDYVIVGGLHNNDSASYPTPKKR